MLPKKIRKKNKQAALRFVLLLIVFLIPPVFAEAREFKLTSPAFEEGGNIPVQHTCNGKNNSPPLKWSDAPKGTQSFALIITDPDAVKPNWIHWVLYNLAPLISDLPGGIPPINRLANGERNGLNSSGKLGYEGPCPPSGTHRYFFKLYALDNIPPLGTGASKEDLEKAMQGHILGEAQLMGRYQSTKSGKTP